MNVGDAQYWRCLDGMTRIAAKMTEKGYGVLSNGDRFWCSICLDWVVAHITEDDRAICYECLGEVFTPNEVKAHEENKPG